MTEKILSIVLVEDNIADAESIRRSIEESYLHVKLTVCHNTAEAKRLIESTPPNLVITESHLLDGQANDIFPVNNSRFPFPVILIASNYDEVITDEDMKSGVLDYFVKSHDNYLYLAKSISRTLREWDNIVALKKAQQSVLEKELEQKEILNSIMDAVVCIDDNGDILTFNYAAEKLFGYTSSEVIGENVLLIIPEKYKAQHKLALTTYLTLGEKKVIGVDGGIELEGLKKDGSIFPVRLSIGESRIEKNGLQRFIGIFQDLTQLKQQEDQLRRSQKMDALGKLTGGIAHDYNNMLGVILGYTELLEASLQDKPDLHNFVNEIFHAGERGVKLTKKLLSFSRVTSSETDILNLNQVLYEQRDMLEKTLTARIKLDFKLMEEDCIVELNQSELEDAIINLCINAMHAIDGNGELLLQTKKEFIDVVEASILQVEAGGYICLSIKDSGRGMDAETKEKIFEPFFTTKGDMGTGLGLSQVYGFVERGHGAIKVDSEEGVGTCLTLYFPSYEKEKVQEKNEISLDDNNKKNSFNGSETILVVDDEAGLKIMTSEILRNAGYNVFNAENGQAALDLIEKEKIDLLFSDVIMPEMDGFELAAIVQKKYPQIKIQLASGFDDERNSIMDDDTLHDNLLPKPYNSENLLRTIRALLDKN